MMGTMLARFLLGMAVFIPLQRMLPHRPSAPILREGWATDALNYFGNGLLYFAIFKLWITLVPNALGWARPFVLPVSLQGQPVFVQALAVLAVGSFVYYWGHRLLHRSPTLWRFHAVHHSATQLDWFGGWRGHVFETCYFTALTSLVMFVLNVSSPATWSFAVYGFFEGQIEHSNLRLPLGSLKWVVPSPWFHHWHHATDPDARNKNFSPYPIWDVLFGTAFMPAGRLPAGFGVEEPVPRDYPGQVAYPLGLAGSVARLERWLEERARRAGLKAA